MIDAAIVFRDRVVAALEHLAAQPAALFAVLWAANAIRFSYGSLIHDARLYAFQVQNQMSGGAFAGDLFLRFGSQDQFTPFSRLMAPVAAVFGVDWTFFILFLIFNALLILGFQRLVTALVDDAVVATAGLLAAMFSPMFYGGLNIFRVAEYFFTPRLMSSALALFALERILRQRYIWGLALALVATVVHPLMGFGAVAIGLTCAVLDRLPRRALAPATAAAATMGIAILASRPLGSLIFGTIDPEWLDVVRRASAYNFPAFWTARDWINVAMSTAIPLWAAAHIRDESPRRARFLAVSAVLGIAGVVTMVVAGMAPYRLLLQGQPYRITWILAAIQIPLAFWLAARLWPGGLAGQTVAILLIASPGLAALAVPEVLLVLIAVGSSFVILNRPASTIGFREALVRSLVGGIAVGFLISTAIQVYRVGSRTPVLIRVVGLKTFVDILLSAAGPIVWLAVLLCGLGLLIGPRRPARAFMAAAVATGIAVHAAAFLSPRLSILRDTEIVYGRDLPFLQSYFQERPHDAPTPPSVYDDIWESTNLVWFDLKSTDYFNLEQMSGVLFSRQTAIEGRRRAAIVRPFELERYAAVAQFTPWGDTLMIRNLFGPTENASPPTRADLERLCSTNEPVDTAILRNDFGELASATNGRLFVYECERVRAASHE